MSLGKPISESDNNKAFLAANDEIRGVETTCYGNCDAINGCFESGILIHDINWVPENQCVDGGVIRSKFTYTNLATSGFKTNIGYSGHFYGIRKYDGLIPNAPYRIVLAGRTGSNKAIETPTEFDEVSYGINEYVGYSGIKFTQQNGDRYEGDKYGKSVSISKNIVAIGAPMKTIEYSEYNDDDELISYNLEKTGAVYIYNRADRPSGTWLIDQDRSPWVLDDILTLPSSILKDYYTENAINSIGGQTLPLPIYERRWSVGQEGREFGHSLSLTVTEEMDPSFEENDKKILVVGAPSAKWNNRNFEELNASGVSIGLIIFTDEFVPSYPLKDSNGNIVYEGEGRNKKPVYLSIDTINQAIQNKDLIFQYFSNPPVKFDIKIIICEPLSENSNRQSLDFPEPKPSNIFKKKIGRNQGYSNETQSQIILSGIKEALNEAFPYDENKLNNNIPPIIGYFIDDSLSLGREALTPAIDYFISDFQSYSFASGLRDFYNTPSSGAVVEFIPNQTNYTKNESWIDVSVDILNNILDTGRLLENDQVRFFTSGVGVESFNDNLSAFNYPPSSGGKVFIFERESGVWNLIQQVSSSLVSYNSYDRFGHSVSISKNAEVITIGSPYTYESCVALEYIPSEKQRLYNGLNSWISYKNSVLGGNNLRFTTLINNYNDWVVEYGTPYANKILYSQLSSDEKFEVRQYFNINEYQKIFQYNGAVGDLIYDKDKSWAFIVNQFSPTSRLGYSTAVNEDGSIIAFGAPTDSFNKFDDTRVYYKNLGYNNQDNTELNTELIAPTWISNVNAGAVRLFESRKYYPHNRVIEYGKFGNLQKNLHDPLDSGHFNYLPIIFQDKNFTITEFDDTDIPEDAGLVFIITPQIDALSDEVAEKIKNWLALGDRNLVLVGNDPIWESDGAYEQSNNIINNILDKLDSRMKLYPARNNIEALAIECGKGLPSFIPTNSPSSYITPVEMNLYGVADIRTNFDKFIKWKYLDIKMRCDSADGIDILSQESLPSPNNKCELPLRNMGDLRAEWKDAAQDCSLRTIEYAVNWPYLYGTYTPNICDPDHLAYKNIRLNNSTQEPPVPILAAAHNVLDTIIIPATEAISGIRPVYKDVIVKKGQFLTSTSLDFEYQASQPTLYWNDSGNNYLSLNYNLYQKNSTGLFYTPPKFEDRQGILQANAIPTQEIIQTSTPTDIQACFAAQDNYSSTSQIIGIASLQTENESTIYLENDTNINFYINLVSKPNRRGGSRIAQLGGWTGRTKFTDANPDSILYEVLENNNNEVILDVTKLSSLYDICWVSNPISLPSQENIQDIKNWLSLGNKKLIITYDNTESQARLVNNIFDLLDSKLYCLYLNSEQAFAQISNSRVSINEDHPVSHGTSTKYDINELKFGSSFTFIPLTLSNDIIPIASSTTRIFTTTYNTAGYWGTDSGLTKVSFPAIAGSGYQVFIDFISEMPSELVPLDFYITNVSQVFNLPYPLTGTTNKIVDNDNIPKITIQDIGVVGSLLLESTNKTSTKVFNVQVLEDKSTIDVYFNTKNSRLSTVTNEYIPKTPRLLSVSGVIVPVITSTTKLETQQTIKEFDKYEYFLESAAQPQQIILSERLDYFTNLNDQYCGLPQCMENGFGNKSIADGPVVVAQESEHFSSFNVGSTRSKITLLSDSSLVQGRCLGDSNFRTSENAIKFIKSLYPIITFSSNNNGRQYVVKEKIIAPDRGSPQKYYALVQNSGLNLLFNGGQNSLDSAPLSSLTSIDSTYDPQFVKDPDPVFLKDEPESEQQEKLNIAIQDFIYSQWDYGGSARFSGIIEGTMYTDAGINGGMPQLMKDTGYDYLDFERFPSGYPGDLFGYSIALSKNKLIVGSPFCAFSSEDIKNWSYFQNNGALAINSGLKTSYNGGAGAVYIFEKTYNGQGLHGSKTPWECVQKLRPLSINTGQDLIDTELSQSVDQLGDNPYNEGYLIDGSKIGDRFGSSVDISSDIIIVGAPGHDFDNVYINGSGDFIRKCFSTEFNVPNRIVIDLGSSGVRLDYPNSGVTVLNQGAVFAFENSIIDWNTKGQKWVLIEKIIPQGYNTRNQIRTNDDRFGDSISIDRCFRSDADYCVVGGSFHHIYGSGDYGSNILLPDAGAAYSYDIMLRGQPPSPANASSYIDAKVFGERSNGNPTINLIVSNNNENMFNYFASGIIYSDEKGQIFVEASGQDTSIKGFITHRPYIVSIDGQYAYGRPINSSMNLFANGTGANSDNINLFTNTSTSANVYNSVGLYNGAIIGFATGTPSGLGLYIDCPEPIIVSNSGLCLFTASGIGLSTDTLNLRIRGK